MHPTSCNWHQFHQPRESLSAGISLTAGEDWRKRRRLFALSPADWKSYRPTTHSSSWKTTYPKPKSFTSCGVPRPGRDDSFSQRSLTPIWQALPCDVMPMDTVAQSCIVHWLTIVGYKVKEGERKKVEKYWYLEGNFVLKAVGFETFGPWGDSAELYAEVGKKFFRAQGREKSDGVFTSTDVYWNWEGKYNFVFNTYKGGRLLYRFSIFLRTKHEYSFTFFLVVYISGLLTALF